MAGLFETLMTRLNGDVVAALAAGGYPALVDGAILFGDDRAFEQSAPPRIIVTPMSGNFGAPDIYSGSTSGISVAGSERRMQNVMPAIHSEKVVLQVRCWGVSIPSTREGDYDVTRALYHAVLAGMQRLAPNHGLETKGAWTKVGVNHYGQEFTFTISLDSPVLSSLLEYSATRQYAPAAVVPVTTDSFNDPATAITEQGC